METGLELTLEFVACDGIAYLSDNTGNRYFRPRDGDKKIRTLIPNRDDSRMMNQFSRATPLGEPGRKFSSIEIANNYITAVTSFEEMIQLLSLSRIGISEKLIGQCNGLVNEIQETLKREYLGILDTIPQFFVNIFIF